MVESNERSFRQTRVFRIERAVYVVADSGGVGAALSGVGEAGFVFPATSGTGGAMVRTLTPWGPVEINVETSDGLAPLERPADEWETEEVHHLTALGDKVFVCEMDGETHGLRGLDVEPGQPYSIRHLARGTSAAEALVGAPDEPVESHLLQIWTTEAESATKSG